MSKKIIARYSSYILPEYEIGDCHKLENELSVYDKRRYQMKAVAIIYDEDKKELRIPGGYSGPYLESITNRDAYNDEYPNPSDKISFKMTNNPRDEKQLKIIKFLCGLGDKFKFTRKHSQLCIDLQTSGGKTYCAIHTICYYGEKAVIFTPSQISALAEHWKTEFLLHTTLNEDQILVVKGSKMCDDIIKGKYKDIAIFIINRATVSSFMRTHGCDEFERLMQKTKAGIKIIDEVHLDFSRCMNIDCYSNIKKNFYFTASAGQGQWDEDKIFQKVFKEIPIMGSELARTEENYIIMICVKFKHIPNIKQRMACKTKDGLSSILYSKYLIDRDNGARHEFLTALNTTMKSVVAKYLIGTSKLLIIGSTQEILDTIAKFLELNFTEYTVGMYTSIISDKKKRNAAFDSQIILATDKGLGTGIHRKDIRLMINVVPYSSKIYAKQLPGRLEYDKDRPAIYIEILNTEFYDAMKQYEKRSKYLGKIAKGNKIIEMKID